MAKKEEKQSVEKDVEEVVAAKPIRKSWLKRNWKWLLPVVIIVFLVIGYFAFASTRSSVVIVTEQVRRGTLEQTVEATGVLESIDEVELSFESSGTVQAVLFDVGDSVKVGDVIARLEMSELQADVDRAAQAVVVAQSRLDLEQAGASSEEISISLAGVDIATAALAASETALSNAKKTGDANVDSANASLESAQDNLTNTINDNEQNIQEATEDLISTLKSNVIEIRSVISKADEVIGVQNMAANDTYQDILSHANPSLLVQAERSYETAILSRDAAEDAVFELSSSDSITVIEATSDLVEDAIDDAGDLLLDTRRVLDATVIETLEFSSADLSALKVSIDSARNSLQLEESTFISDTNMLEEAMLDSDSSESSAENALSEAESAYDVAVISRDTSIASAEADLSIKTFDLDRAKASLADIQADPRFVDVAGFVAEVQRAKADLAAAKARAENAEIIAPIAGEVTSVLVEVGEQATLGTPVAVVQTIEENFHVITDVDESDIPKIELNDSVTLTFDAFGDDVEFAGTVVKIDPAEKEVEGVTFYEIEVALDELSTGLKPGMSADVTVMTETIKDVLIIPQRAILERDGEKYVRIPTDGNRFEDRVITTGIRGDGGLIEILTGVTEGESVIISIRE